MMEEKKQLRSIVISRSPKTVLIVDSSMSNEDIKKRMKKYLNNKGQLKIDTVADYEIYN